MTLMGIAHERQVSLPVTYKGLAVAVGYRVDVIVEHRLILEIKASERTLPVHEQQILTYLRLSGLRFGLLLNFNQAVLREGIRRITN